MTLRTRLKPHGLTKRDLAARLGITESATWRWENGRDVPGYVFAYLDALDEAARLRAALSAEIARREAIAGLVAQVQAQLDDAPKL